jgi:hypothetical protein
VPVANVSGAWTGGATLPSSNITGVWTGGLQNFPRANITGTMPYANLTGIATTGLTMANITGAWTNGITVPSSNVTGTWTGGITIPYANITGIATSGLTMANITGAWTNGITVPAANLSAGTFASGNGGFTFPQNLTLNEGLKLNVTAIKPTCAVAFRGTIWFDQAAAGSADIMYACMKNATNNYNWVMVAVG